MGIVEFNCKNCGSVESRNILEMQHAVVGCLKSINRSADCCKKPSYVDELGIMREVRMSSVRQLY